jgi:hypothetical protein
MSDPVNISRASITELAAAIAGQLPQQGGGGYSEPRRNQRQAQAATDRSFSFEGGANIGLASDSAAALSQNLSNAAGAALQFARSVDNMPQTMGAIANLTKSTNNATNALAQSWGDLGGTLTSTGRSTNAAAKEFNALNPMMHSLVENFNDITFGSSRNMRRLGHDALQVTETFSNIVNDTIMLRSLADFDASAAGDEAAERRMMNMAARTTVFGKSLSMTNEDLQTLYDLQLTVGGNASDRMIADLSNITLGLAKAGHGTRELAGDVAKLMEDYGTFGRLGVNVTADFAQLATELEIDTGDASKLVDLFKNQTDFMARMGNMDMIIGKHIDYDPNELMQLAHDSPAGAVARFAEIIATQIDTGNLSPAQASSMAANLGAPADFIARLDRNGQEAQASLENIVNDREAAQAAVEAQARALLESRTDSEITTMEQARDAIAAKNAAEASVRGVEDEELQTPMSKAAEAGIRSGITRQTAQLTQSANDLHGRLNTALIGAAHADTEILSGKLEEVADAYTSNVQGGLAATEMTLAANRSRTDGAGGSLVGLDHMTAFLADMGRTDNSDSIEAAAQFAFAAKAMQETVESGNLEGDELTQARSIVAGYIREAQDAGATDKLSDAVYGRHNQTFNPNDIFNDDIKGDFASVADSLGSDIAGGTLLGMTNSMTNDAARATMISAYEGSIREAFQMQSPATAPWWIELWGLAGEGANIAMTDKLGLSNEQLEDIAPDELMRGVEIPVIEPLDWMDSEEIAKKEYLEEARKELNAALVKPASPDTAKQTNPSATQSAPQAHAHFYLDGKKFMEAIISSDGGPAALSAAVQADIGDKIATHGLVDAAIRSVA